MKKRNILIASGLTLGVIAGATFGKIPVNVMNDNYIQEKYSDISQEDLEGKVIWEKKNVSYNQTGITALKDGVIAVASDGQVVKYNFDGNVLWQNEDVSYSYTGVTTVGDGVIAVATGGQVVKYDLNGNVSWKNEDLTYSYTGVTTVEDGVVAVATGGRTIKYSLNGDVIWQNEDVSYSYTGVTTVGDGVIAVAHGGQVVKYDLDGNVVWNKLERGDKTYIYYGVTTIEDGVVAVDSNGKVVKYDLNGNAIWKNNDVFSYYRGVTTVEDGVIAVETGGQVVKYDLDGNVLWQNKELSNRYGAVTSVENGVIAVAGGRVVKYGVKNQVIDKSALDKLLEDVSKLTETDYSSVSWEELQNAISGADTLTKQSEINSKIVEIQTALDNLGVDTSVLDKLLENISKLNETDYSSTSWEELQNAINDTDNLTKQSEIDSKVSEIQTALNNLGIDRSKLDDLLAEVDRLISTDYSTDSWNKLQEAISNAGTVTTQAQVENAIKEITNAKNNLGVDRSKLDKLLADVSKLNERDYYKDEWNNLQIAISGTDNLTKQSEINSKIVEIQTALDNLGVDKTKLSELLDRIDKMNKDIYTKDSLDSLMKVVDSVEEYTKQYEVDEKVAELEEALKNLKLDPDKVQIQKGDLDKNGIVNANDAAIALDLYKYGNVSDEELLIGDMDNNGIINANDAALILDIYKYGK